MQRRIVAMAALTAGVQYSLSSNQNNGLMPKQRTSKNKTLFFVKLTDSCLKAVEDYLRCCQQVSGFPSETTRVRFSRAFTNCWPSARFLSLLRITHNLFFLGHVLNLWKFAKISRVFPLNFPMNLSGSRVLLVNHCTRHYRHSANIVAASILCQW